ncbi:MAG: glycosyltransferase family 4 protein [Gemmatimonadota bacterium]|nr:glycosyltransferase family 4 protein [Gemmatimonadota bacterium]MDH4347541.1 glycosyltransferase family 4 protein [Gemmatimonadota bacterium]MDH5282757.1 glycosyltransferase family 4 protein [Gemmatimonadota bacterium]
MDDGKLRALVSLHQGGGAGSVNSTLRLALGLRACGVAVRFVCPPASPVESEALAGGLEVHPLPLARQSRWANALALHALLRRHPVDVIDSHGSRDRQGLILLGLLGRLPAPLIISRRSFPRSTRLATWLGSRVASRLVTLSQPVADELVRRGASPRKVVMIPNGVLLDRIDGAVAAEDVESWRRTIEWEPTRRTVAIVARPKDQWVVVEALALLRTPVRLVLAGLDGDMLTRPLPALPSRHRVIRLPFRYDTRPLYELVDLVLHPSRWDALPQAVLEAMALGKPVAASAATGNAEIIRDGVDGLLVAPTDRAAWASAIDMLLGDAPLAARLGAEARRRAREDFRFDVTVERTLALYREVIRHARSEP